ncbi:MAG: hypothetical protein U1G07_23090 [Verrucomicrobiota bacterium]
MKTVIATVSCLLAALSTVCGQGISVALQLEQENYLPGESLPVKVRITNFTGQNLRLGEGEAWLTFSVEDSRHLAVPKRGTVPVGGEFVLEPSTTGTKKVDIAPYFDLTQPGRYQVSATVMVPQWRDPVQAKGISFDIIKGSSLWDQEFGVPGTGKGETSFPEVRRFALVQTLHSKVIRLYFRLTDSKENYVYRVFPLGQMVSFSNPEPQVDKFSNLHVLYQTSGRLFMHCVINPDGVLLARETYEYSSSRPVLHAENDGRITVNGGMRRFMSTDLPPPMSSTQPANAKLPQP